MKAGQLVRDGGRLVTGSGQGGRREGDQGGGTAAAVLAGCLVRNKSKTICVPLFMVLFYVAVDLFFTVVRFAPMERLSGGGGGGAAGCRLAGLYPPIRLYGWDDKAV